MLPEIGLIALIFAFCFSSLQIFIPLMGAKFKSASCMAFARYAAFGQCFFVALSVFLLVYALVSNDFSVLYVAQNSNSHLPLIYKICAFWGAHEGSLLLWVFILNIWTVLVCIFSRSLPLDFIAKVIAILGIISSGFLLFILKTSNPFLRLLANTPVDGRDLNPLLQDPGLAIHPPMLYIGYVGFAVAFAFAIAALMTGRLDNAWARWSRPWTLVAWSFLTFGITLGSWWAYRVLGWGGWWFWDPVENASFLPWLTGTALIHSLLVAEKRNIFKTWTVLLAIIAFSLSLMGTFLVRSGVLVSVHAFANDPQRGVFMLKFLLFIIGGSLLLFAWRGQLLKNEVKCSLFSRETMLLTNNVLLIVAMCTVLLGTLYPLILDALAIGKISVGPPYFNAVFVPLVLPILILMGIGPAIHWSKGNFILTYHKLKYSMLIAIAAAIILPFLITGQINYYLIIGLLLSLWIILATLQDNFFNHSKKITTQQFTLSRLGMIFAHIGFAVTAIGIVVSNTYSIQKDVSMNPSDSLNIANYHFTFLNTYPIQGPNYSGDEAAVLVQDSSHKHIVLHPQQRIYKVQNVSQTKTAIDAGIFRDLYVALGEPLENNAWSLRIYYKPFIRWIWLGGILMLIGGLLAAFDKRYRRHVSGKNYDYS